MTLKKEKHMSSGRVYGYLAHAARKLSVFTMSPTGELKQIQEAFVNEGEFPKGDVKELKLARDQGRHLKVGRFVAMCVSPDRRFLFASNRTAPYSIRSFAINRDDGTLMHLGDSPTVESAPFITTDRTGRFLLVAHNPAERTRRTGYVSVAAINEGFVQPPHQVIHTPQKTHSIRVDGSNRFVMAPCCDSDVIVRFGFDEATGLLDPNLLAMLYLRPGTGPRHFVFHPNNRFVYTNGEADGSLYVYSFDPRDGAMSELQIESVWPEGLPEGVRLSTGDLHITPNGKFLYTAVRIPSACTIVGMRIDPMTGLITSVEHTAVEKVPRGFNIDPFGRFLVVNGLETRKAVTYAIDPESGSLTKVAEVSTMEDPNWIELVSLP